MTRALPPAVVPHPRPRVGRTAGFLSALGAAVAPPDAVAAVAAVDATATGTPLAWVVAAAVVAGLAIWGVRAERRSRDRARALQQARAELQGLRSTLDVWQWRTDAEHRVVDCRAPAVPHGAGPVLRTGARLWDLLSVADGTGPSLQARAEQHVPLHALPVLVAGAGAGRPAQVVLHAQPVLDAEGRFAGHVGTARPVQDGPVSLLTDLLMALPLPVLRMAAPARGGLPRVVQHNPAAAPWAPTGPDTDGRGLLAALPAGVRPVLEQALAQGRDTLAEAPGGWALRVHRLPCATDHAHEAEALVVFQRAAPPAAPAVEVSASADEAESFGYTVSHDLRAPLRVVEGFTKIVKEDYAHALDRVGVDHLDRVLAAAARMNAMIDALLALSQLSSRPLARQPVNLSMLAGYIVDDLRRQSPERVVDVQIEPGLQCHGDATLLRVVLENLLGNAWKYTGKRREGRIWVERSEHEGRPAVTVRDNGAGFDMRFADRLFGVFQRLHSANDFQGTGIGLASVRRILRRHGGDIWAEAEVDRGARFQFWV